MKKQPVRKNHMYIECEPVAVKPVKDNGYGSLPDLEEEELADPQEFEKLYLRQEFAPILTLPVKKKDSSLRPEYDEDGFAIGAFATVDFDRLKPALSKLHYKADRLREERKNVLITYAIIRDRIPGLAKYKVLKLVQRGVIDIGDIADMDMYQMAEQWLRAERLRKQIRQLEEVSKKRQERRLKAWLDSLG